MMKTPNFALIGAAGYVAPRHMQAIQDIGGRLVAAFDPHDSVGILDRYSFDTKFFTEFERFDRYLEKIKGHIDYISICSPNHLHDAHIRFALRLGADVICEKPLVINPWNLDALEVFEERSGCKVWTILQLRHHPAIVKLKESLSKGPHMVNLKYITARGPWYHRSWKGDPKKSGGIITNIGIHLFDMLLWLFGDVISSELIELTKVKAKGNLELQRAFGKWFLSTDLSYLPDKTQFAHRSIVINDLEIDFSGGFTNLHTFSYKKILRKEGFGIKEARPSVELTYRLKL
jgi:UDP-N-acetyl-2-amino-2-deoxyglucuronate dehydrogenase